MATANPGFGTSPAAIGELTHDYAGTTGGVAYPDSDGILFQNTNGQAAVWQTDAAGLQTENTLGPNPGTGWDALLSGGFGLAGVGVDNAATVFQNDTTGAIQIWTTLTNLNTAANDGFAGPNVATSEINVISNATGLAATPGANWQLVGLGQFINSTSDGGTGLPTGAGGGPDMLFQNSQTGAVGEWYLDQTAAGVFESSFTFKANNTDTSWKVVGANDFASQTAAAGQAGVDGNTISSAPGAGGGEQYDIWFQNTVTGQVAGWHVGGQDLTNNPVVTQFADLPNPGPNWQLVSTDGYFGGTSLGGDLLFQNTVTGEVGVWEMSTAAAGGLTTTTVGATADITLAGTHNTDPTWVLLGAGNYSGHTGLINSSTDLLFQNSSSGAVAMWIGNDTPTFAAAANHLLGSPGTSWTATHVQDALLNA